MRPLIGTPDRQSNASGVIRTCKDDGFIKYAILSYPSHIGFATSKNPVNRSQYNISSHPYAGSLSSYFDGFLPLFVVSYSCIERLACFSHGRS